ncbi:MAG: hypothetical protein NW201_13060 [Gemmatimonadales bacterium]|nr:hypothetical protein [Gemmatimonadales bacterium]
MRADGRTDGRAHGSRRRMVGLVAGLVALAAAGALAAQAPKAEKAEKAPKAEKADSGPKGPKKPAPLFRSDSVLALELEFDLKTVYGDRDSTKKIQHPATLRWGGEQAAVTLETRGHFRRQFRNCDVPPLRVRFPEKPPKGSPFEDAKSLKLVTHCKRNDATYGQITLSEHALYRTYNLLTERSYLSRLVWVRYRNRGAPAPADSAWGLLLEADGMLAERLRWKEFDQQGVRNDETVQEDQQRVDVWNYFIANSDWSVPGLHNITLFSEQDTLIHAVPYDFDFSGVTEAPYARPPSQLPIRSVRERFYRGYCRPTGALDATLALYREKRGAIEALWRDDPRLDAKRKQRTLEFLGEFWKAIDDPKGRKKAFEETCRKP